MSTKVESETSNDTPNNHGLAAGDTAKIHAEINQIHNQRFVLTTTAITVFGVFAALVPKDLLPSDVIPRPSLLLAGTTFLTLFLLFLYFWNLFLSKLQIVLASYLVERGASEWEATWKIYHAEGGKWVTAGTIETGIFCCLGMASIAWAPVVATAQNITLSSTAILWLAILGITYLVVILSTRTHENSETIKAEKMWGRAIRKYKNGLTADATTTTTGGPSVRFSYPDRDENAEAIYEIRRKYIEHEDELIHHRTTTFTTIQSFLLATFALSYLKKVEIAEKMIEVARTWEGLGSISFEFDLFMLFLAIVGIATSMVAFRSIRAAQAAIFELDKGWNQRCAPTYLPGITGGGSPYASKHGKSLATSTPVLMSVIWLVILVFQCLTMLFR